MPEVVIQKFGGTSLGSADKILKATEPIQKRLKEGKQVVVVVSAMAGETDRLIQLSSEMGDEVPRRELDVLLSTGEQAAAALMAMALHRRGVESVSLLGHQIPLRTDACYGKARIESVSPASIRRCLDTGKVVVISGYQGVNAEGEITTLGRGGSDLSAVALAAAMDAVCCEIYTDVPGVFTADPQICGEARPMPWVSYDEMLELASLGAKVLQARSVQLAKRYLVPVWVGCSSGAGKGTWVTQEEERMERTVVSGIGCDRHDARISVRNLKNQSKALAQVFSQLAEAGILVDVIVQDQISPERTSFTFTLGRDSLQEGQEVVRDVLKEHPEAELSIQEKVAKISAVGLGMRSHSGVAAMMFKCLAQEGIDVLAVSTSEIKISCVIEDRYSELAVRSLHETFGLGKEPN